MKSTIDPISYSIHNRKYINALLKKKHDAKRVVAQKLGLPLPTDRDLEKAIAQNDRRYSKFLGTHRYVPHQGKRETERRRRRAEIERLRGAA